MSACKEMKELFDIAEADVYFQQFVLLSNFDNVNNPNDLIRVLAYFQLLIIILIPSNFPILWNIAL